MREELALARTTGGWKLAHKGRATDYKGRKIPRVENFLSNTAEDTTETKNLANAHPGMVKQLTKLREQWLKKLKQK